MRAGIARAWALVIVLVTGALGGSAGAQTAVRLGLDWRFEGPSAIFLHGIDKGLFAARGLAVTVEPGTGSRDMVAKIAAGTFDIGFGDINTLAKFRDDNPTVDIKAVMMVHDRAPFAIIGRKSRGISPQLKSLEGKKIGAPVGDGAFAQWPVLKALEKLDDSTTTFVNVGFPVREPMLAAGEVDAAFGFPYSVAVSLRSRGVPAEDIVVISMADYGLEAYGNAIMVSPKFLAENPGAVREFLLGFVASLKEVVASPEQAIASVLARNDTARREVEIERLRMMLSENVMTPWVQVNGFGGIDKARFQRSLDQLGQGVKLKAKPKPDDIFTDAFLPATETRVVN